MVTLTLPHWESCFLYFDSWVTLWKGLYFLPLSPDLRPTCSFLYSQWNLLFCASQRKRCQAFLPLPPSYPQTYFYPPPSSMMLESHSVPVNSESSPLLFQGSHSICYAYFLSYSFESLLLYWVLASFQLPWCVLLSQDRWVMCLMERNPTNIMLGVKSLCWWGSRGDTITPGSSACSSGTPSYYYDWAYLQPVEISRSSVFILTGVFILFSPRLPSPTRPFSGLHFCFLNRC